MVKTEFNEIDEGTGYVGYREAFDIIGANVRPAGEEEISLSLCVSRVTAADLVALVRYPSAVVSGEFCEERSPGEVDIKADAGPGRNILRAGDEVEAGEAIVRKGERLLPGYLGLAAGAGRGR